MPKIVFDEYYGKLTYTLRAAIRKFNVSPADYDWIRDVKKPCEGFAEMEEFIRRHSQDGYYREPAGMVEKGLSA